MSLKLAKIAVVIGLVLYLLILIAARAPAGWGTWALHREVPNLWLTGVDGTLWEGRAGGGMLVLGTKAVPMENVRWKLQPLSLLTLNPCAQVQTRLLDQVASGELCYSMSGTISARDVQLDAPVALANDWLPFDLSGQVSLQVQQLRAQGLENVQSLEGSLSWRGARWHNTERWVPLGDFAASVKANDRGGVHAEIFDLAGPFKVDLTGEFVWEREPVIKGTVTAGEETPAQIRESLQFIATDIDGDVYTVAWPPGT